MRIVGWDTETHLFSPTSPFPRVVSHAFALGGGSVELLPAWEQSSQPVLSELLHSAAAGDVRLVGHNIAYDLVCTMRMWPDVVPLVFNALDADGVMCTRLQYQLHELATQGEVPRASLQKCVEHLFDLQVNKGDDTWRLRYAELDGVDVPCWPEAAIRYALQDAILTRELALALPVSPDVYNQTRAAVALALMTDRGIRVDFGALQRKEKELREEYEACLAEARGYGLVRGNGTKDMEAIRGAVEVYFQGQGCGPPLTDKGAVKTDSLTIERLPDTHPVRSIDRLKQAEKLLSFISKYRDAAEQGAPLHPRVNTLLETGRVSMSAPNLQQLPRKGGLREMFVPSPGYVFVSCDLDTAELRALGQTCLDIVGWSRLAELFQNDPGADPHRAFALQMLGAGEHSEEAILAMRQRAKAANFGYPGGMGAAKFIETQLRQGAVFDLHEARELKSSYLDQWPEMREYFDWVSDVESTTGSVTLPVSGRSRAGVGFCDGANTGFQGRTADVAKLWVYLIVREAMTDHQSPLFGCYLVNFVHDEVMLEAPEKQASDAASRVEELAEVAGAWHLPDVPTRAGAVLMRRWYKGAKKVTDTEGRLIPWEPQERW